MSHPSCGCLACFAEKDSSLCECGSIANLPHDCERQERYVEAIIDTGIWPPDAQAAAYAVIAIADEEIRRLIRRAIDEVRVLRQEFDE